MGALAAAAPTLAALGLPARAPPAFLLDAARGGGPAEPRPETFDNRWMVFRADFPSGEALYAAGVRRVLLVRQGGLEPADDLLPVLRRFERAGLSLRACELGRDAPPSPCRLPRWGLVRDFWIERVTPRWWLRRPGGEFGKLVPKPSVS